MKKYFLLFSGIFLFLVTGLLSFITYNSYKELNNDRSQVIRVMAYSSLLKSWGAGQEISQAFEAAHGVRVEWIEVSNAGMILENLRGRKAQELPDVVLGLDLLSLNEARSKLAWRDIKTPTVHYTSDIPKQIIYKDFIPFDWAPMTFLFRRGELKSPEHLIDLLKPEYANSLALQDPRSSSTGLYYLMWILSVFGEDAGFKYLQMLKPSIRIVSPSWSSSYSLFQNKQTPMVFSHFTSTIYHYINEKNYLYQPVYFNDPHIYNVEYMAIPQDCQNCEMAEKFIEHMLSNQSQKVIMEKNYMLPVIQGVKDGTPFDFPKSIKLIEPKSYEVLLDRRKEILKKWSELKL